MSDYIYDDDNLGPIGAHDAALLGAVASYVGGCSVLEFGSAFGDSAAVWIAAGVHKLVCVDSSITADMQTLANKNPGIVYLMAMSQDCFVSADKFDIIFFDASHDLVTNQRTLDNVKDSLNTGGMVIVHDTGLWAHCAMKEKHFNFCCGHDTPEGFAHQPGEIEFVKWLRSNGWQCVDFGSKTQLRHGITICQNLAL